MIHRRLERMVVVLKHLTVVDAVLAVLAVLDVTAVTERCSKHRSVERFLRLLVRS